MLGKLFREGRIEAVLPLDDKARHLAAKTLQPAALEARQKAMVNNLLARDNKFALCVLGGSHDLTAQVPVGVEYLRVAVPSWKILRHVEQSVNKQNGQFLESYQRGKEVIQARKR